MSDTPRRPGDRRSPARRRRRRPVRFVLLTMVWMLALSLIGGAAFAGGLLSAPVDFVESPVARPALILDSQGRLVATIRPPQQRVPVESAQIPDVVRAAVVAAEDSGFYSHSGVDAPALLRAAWKDLTADGNLQGGSTITQQYVKNTFLDNARTPMRKLREATLALRLETRLSKDEILTRYLNDVYLGNGTYGVQAASRYYFGSDVADLDLARASLIAGIIPAPSLWNPVRDLDQAKRRQLYTLNRMVAAGSISPQEASAAYTEQVEIIGASPAGPVEQTVAPEFRDMVLTRLKSQLAELGSVGDGGISDPLYQAGLRVTTTLDLDLQRSAVDAVAAVLDQPDDPESAVVAIDPRNGDIKAVTTRFDAEVAGTRVQGYQTGGFNLATQAARSSGSLIKTFTLAAALENGSELTDTRFAPRCIDIPNPGGEPNPYRPCNAEPGESGRYTLAKALVSSINTVYAPLAQDIGLQKVMDVAGAAGLGPESNLKTNLANSLGVDITPLSAAAAYGTVVNHGVAQTPRTLLAIRAAGDSTAAGDLVWQDEDAPGGSQAIPVEIADKVTTVLQDVVDKGTGRSARQDYPLFGKTGTNADRDAWFVGCTRELCVAAWVGFDDNRSMKGVHGLDYVYGGTLPAQLVDATLKGYQAARVLAQDSVEAQVSESPSASPTPRASTRRPRPRTTTPSYVPPPTRPTPQQQVTSAAPTPAAPASRSPAPPASSPTPSPRAPASSSPSPTRSGLPRILPSRANP